MAKNEKIRPVWPLWVLTAALAAAVIGWYALGNAGRKPMEEGSLDRAALAEQFAPLDLNGATAEELEELPGIGPVLAEKIVAWREENGPFSGPSDVLSVSGIGPATYEAIEPYIGF